jgi:hypothetical protein
MLTNKSEVSCKSFVTSAEVEAKLKECSVAEELLAKKQHREGLWPTKNSSSLWQYAVAT